VLEPALLVVIDQGRLEQFDEISRRILQEDLLAAGPGHDVVAELSAGET
jgi:hypothetical protein